MNIYRLADALDAVHEPARGRATVGLGGHILSNKMYVTLWFRAFLLVIVPKLVALARLPVKRHMCTYQLRIFLSRTVGMMETRTGGE